eukprot:NODE_2150_length_1278_cov_95.594793_g1868_i1.p1 GENE.NODE_2150_length_1278_cov_95.594793_g1868_i1~~NODE_2150_length_1278_cov_95.594793_g1868_i1.p1  ORF type:complete len:281 (+),score=43.27 NODE_2150_length_1278_cov_95.594793_g1868_i1:77-844(+)
MENFYPDAIYPGESMYPAAARGYAPRGMENYYPGTQMERSYAAEAKRYEQGVQSWAQYSRHYEKWADWDREQQLLAYYRPQGKEMSSVLSPWVFPDGTACFYCRGVGHRGEIGFPDLPCRGCQSETFLKPNQSTFGLHCTECAGTGVWKHSPCRKCGGKRIGSPYLPFACPKKTCGSRTRTNWEMELHQSLVHGKKAPAKPTWRTGAEEAVPAARLGRTPKSSHGRPMTQGTQTKRVSTRPFLLPFGEKWYPNEL